MKQAIISHILQTLPTDVRYALAQRVLTGDVKDTEIETYIASYFDGNIIEIPSGRFIVLYENGENKVYSISKKFELAQPVDENQVIDKFNSSLPGIDVLNKLVGFMAAFKGDQYVFKTKSLERKGHKGARCDQSGKGEALRVLMEITEGEFGDFSIENTRGQSQRYFCVLQELALRCYNADGKDGRVWFLTPEQSTGLHIEKLTRK
jgi:hypothetical protein